MIAMESGDLISGTQRRQRSYLTVAIQLYYSSLLGFDRYCPSVAGQDLLIKRNAKSSTPLHPLLGYGVHNVVTLCIRTNIP